jgi:asparagine synthase (glutamine-hydrolysing)
MNLFLCVLDSEFRDTRWVVRGKYEAFPRSRQLRFEWQSLRTASVLLAAGEGYTLPKVATDGDWAAVGDVRLDNRDAVGVLGAACETGLSDLDLVLRLVARHGAGCIHQLLGDFAFLVWNAATRSVIAAVDAFALRKLYYAEQNGLFVFASRAAPLAHSDSYSVQCLTEWVTGSPRSPELTVYESVKAIPAGTIGTIERGKLRTHQYWSPRGIEQRPDSIGSELEAAEVLRQLLIEAVSLRLSGDENTWAQLSGGLDSSSIVSIAQWLLQRGAFGHGLAGTITYVDRQNTGADEREYSDAIVGCWGVRNEAILDPPLWYDHRYPPPEVDQPRPDFMFYPRECRLCEIVRGAGGRVLLTGQASDELLRGNMYFFADWLAQGRLWATAREMACRAAIGRVSFWELAYRNAITPLLPSTLRRWVGPEVTQLPPWVHPAIVRRFGLEDRAFEKALCSGRIGHKYHDAIVDSLITVSRLAGHIVLEDVLDVRHPFLYRPLVEFGLQLPPELCVRPYARKWILREAMRGIVPEIVRTRIGKGTTLERHAWSLASQRQLLGPLAQQPVLADMGVIDGKAFRAAFDAAPNQSKRTGDPQVALQRVLAVEAWLQLRAGKWPPSAGLERQTCEATPLAARC